MDNIAFQRACDKILKAERERKQIGTLSEKTLHAILKNYFEPDINKHEIKISGYFADIANENGIIEIQTGNFNVLRKKLNVFLEIAPVTLVYPIPYIKWLYWIEEDTNQIGPKRKSPKKGSPYMALIELYKIKEYLLHPNLNLCLVMINMEEYKILNGWSIDKKKGSSRYDRIPTEIVEEIYIPDRTQYHKLIPKELEDGFTSKDYKKKSGLTLSKSQTALNVLNYVGVVERIGKIGNSYLYARAEERKVEKG